MTDFVDRRGLLALASAGGVLAAATGSHAATPSAWRPTPEAEDGWMDLPGRHRMAFDAAGLGGADNAVQFVNNFYLGNKLGYGLEPKDLGVIVILRHFATAYAFGDATWARYGEAFGRIAAYKDDKTNAVPVRNTLLTTASTDPDQALASLSGLADRGVQFAVCGMAVQFLSQKLAGNDAARAQAIRAELTADFIRNAHLTPAGIVALNRTQERGYAIAHMG
jgi:intracellular sulfur oxidation DsrE/DsrF family protein